MSTPRFGRLRQAVGLRGLDASSGTATAKAAKVAAASFKQYREKDGQFYFKLVDSQGNVLIQSAGFNSPKDAGLAIAQLQQFDGKAKTDLGSPIGLVEGVKLADVAAALEALRTELAEKAKSKGPNLKNL